MNMVIFISTIFSVLLLLSCQQRVDIESEKKAVKDVLDKYVKSVEEEDMNLYSQIVSHDANMVNVGGTESISCIVGWKELEEVMQGQNRSFSNTEIDVTKEKIYISPKGEFAWAVTYWDLKTVINDATYLLPLRCSWILEKRNNNWLIIHFNKSFGVKSLSDYKIEEQK